MIESTWKDETRGLLETVSTLEEDNQKLTLLVTENLRVCMAWIANFFFFLRSKATICLMRDD